MYNVGDMIVYGGTGVCEVIAITIPEFALANGKREYYELKPLYERGTIYAPVDNGQISMRPVMEKKEADDIIDMIPKMEIEEFAEKSTQKLSEHYKSKLRNQDCEDLIRVIMSAHEKKIKAEEANKKFGQIDKKYMKQAESLLYGEFAIALNIDKDEVSAYISNRVQGK